MTANQRAWLNAPMTYDDYHAQAAARNITPYTRSQWDRMSETQRRLITLAFSRNGK